MASMKDVAEGLVILMKYDDKAPDGSPDPCGVSAEHDVIYAGPEDVEVSEEDHAALEKRGWHWEEGFECWAHFT